MKFCHHRVLWLLGLVLVAGLMLPVLAAAQNDSIVPLERQQMLLDLSTTLAAKKDAARTPLYFNLLSRDTGVQGDLNRNPNIQLMGIAPNGRPMFYDVENLTAAQSVSTDEVWSGGSSGLNLTGLNQPGQLAIWDGGGVLMTHQEFQGRVVYGDVPAGTHYHSTHVAGTMIAGGIEPQAIGMSYEGLITSYEWTDDCPEMATAAAGGLLVSQHSYGFVTGWRWYGEPDNYWIWFGWGPISETEDYAFGFYDQNSVDYDAIAYDAPNYLICKSAGNDRNDAGPAAGEYYYYWDPYTEAYQWINTPRDADGGPDGYDSIGYIGNAKNILCVGAVEDIPGGWTAPEDVVMSTFSNWGPTDDGRIKPDIVTNGIGLYSAIDTDDISYASFSGTSMAGPVASGSANLLAMHYIDTHGTTATAATLKALIIQTADEAGPNPGPDYMNGWGMMNTQHAAEIISDDVVVGNRVFEDNLVSGATQERIFYSDGSGPIRLTMCWTDAPGAPATYVVDNPTLVLVYDLDMRLTKLDDSTVFAPYILDPANPADAATTGDNFRDNVEQIYVEAPSAGWYCVSVSHKSGLALLGQDFSLIQTGLQEIYYVSLAGSDTNPGTSALPFATIQHGINAVMGTGEVVVMPGAYPQSALITMKSGVNLHGQSGDPAAVEVTGLGFDFNGVDSSATLADMTIAYCFGPTGTILMVDSSPMITNCIIAFNQNSSGGTVNIGDSSSPQITSCTFVKNDGAGGGAIFSYGGAQPVLTRCIISNTEDGMAVLANDEFSVPVLECCDLYMNTLGDWTGHIAPQVDMAGNFSADPCYCDLEGGIFSLSEDSWCLPGNHPWGCDDLVGAQSSGCPPVGCGGVVATFLADFDVTMLDVNATIRWNTSTSEDAMYFHLIRNHNGAEAEIPYDRMANTFEAIDTTLPANATGTVVYSLYLQTNNGWTLLKEVEKSLDVIPVATKLSSVYPNPFNPSATIQFAVGQTQKVTLAVYDMAGQRVAVLEDQIFTTGTHTTVWNGTDSAGRIVSAGTYLLRLESETTIESRKLMLLK